ncbi:hypothetical protein [Grimontia sp. NTOU-MAR1]|uniref:hypothetical protein n=1 Tax=Grimontia sp. NTOU-MAR1 TaxID=3111011 RepID=UPI002DB747C2|nr:hypothetical protein [Grimontia sp. NTOU-MAR1]WRV98533.1 hypothetical protein VP504_03595 [Grimontia sp. NTOU-MAR1]
MEINSILDAFTNTKLIASLFAIVGLVACVILMFKSDRKLVTQLLGAILVVSISFSAHSALVYTISVFVIATLVTELQFLEKIAALIWNRKEYWEYLTGKASREDIEEKARSEVDEELEKESIAGTDEVEAVEEVEEPPTGITDTEEKSPPVDRNQLVKQALQFERSVLTALDTGNIPFSHKSFHKELRISGSGRGSIIDGVIETKDVHYLIEVKNVTRPSALINAVHQIEFYKTTYENYLRERNISVAVQPLIIVPQEASAPSNFRGIPVAKYDVNTKEFFNLKSTYPDYQSRNVENVTDSTLKELLLKFLKRYSRWAFSPLRVQKWGSRQPGFESFDLYSVNEIREKLEEMLSDSLLEERQSKKGNKLYRIKL